MRNKVKRSSAEAALQRVLDALTQELIEASDEEILEAATALRMDLDMPGSAAWAGVTYPARWRLADNFDLERQPQGKLPKGH